MRPARDGSAADADTPPPREDDGRARVGNPHPRVATQDDPSSGQGGRAAQRPTDQDSIVQLLRSLTDDLIGQLSGRIHLVALELKRARQAFMHMVVLVVAAGILVATAWVALWVAVIKLILSSGIAWYAAAALVLLLNLGGAWLAFRRARALSVYLTLPATVRRLTVAPSTPVGDDAQATGAEAIAGRRSAPCRGIQPGASGS